MDYKKTKASRTTITRDMSKLCTDIENQYEVVALLGKRANQIGQEIKKELDAKLQDYESPQDQIEEIFENKEQIEISRSYEVIPKPTLIATQEFIDGQLVYRNTTNDNMK